MSIVNRIQKAFKTPEGWHITVVNYLKWNLHPKIFP
jgi:hypothetical protein